MSMNAIVTNKLVKRNVDLVQGLSPDALKAKLELGLLDCHLSVSTTEKRLEVALVVVLPDTGESAGYYGVITKAQLGKFFKVDVNSECVRASQLVLNDAIHGSTHVHCSLLLVNVKREQHDKEPQQQQQKQQRAYWQVGHGDPSAVIPLLHTTAFHTSPNYPILLSHGPKTLLYIQSSLNRNKLLPKYVELDRAYTEALLAVDGLKHHWRLCVLNKDADCSDVRHVIAKQQHKDDAIIHSSHVQNLTVEARRSNATMPVCCVCETKNGDKHISVLVHEFKLSANGEETLDMQTCRMQFHRLISDIRNLRCVLQRGAHIYNPFLQDLYGAATILPPLKEGANNTSKKQNNNKNNKNNNNITTTNNNNNNNNMVFDVNRLARSVANALVEVNL